MENFDITETVLGVVAEEKYYVDKNNTLLRLKERINLTNFGRSEQIVEQSQNCAQSRENFIKIFDLLVKFGIIPNIPFLRDLLIKLGLGGSSSPTLYNAYGGMPFYPAPVNYPVGYPQQGYFGQQGGYFVPYGAAPQQQFGFPQGNSLMPSQQQFGFPQGNSLMTPQQQFGFPQRNSLVQPQFRPQFQHPYYPQPPQQPQIGQNFYSPISQNSIYPQQAAFQAAAAPQSFVYPSVNQQTKPSPAGFSNAIEESNARTTLGTLDQDFGVAVPLLLNQADQFDQQRDFQYGIGQPSDIDQYYTNDPTYNPFVSPLMSDE